MTRVLMSADAVGGVWTYACELARALAARGLATTIATIGPAPTTDQLAAAHDIPQLEIVSSRFQLEWMEDPWRDVEAAGRWLLDLESRIRPLLVHLNGYAHAALPFGCPTVVVGHSCVLSWQEATGGAIDREWLARYARLVTAGIRAAAWVVAPTGSMLESLQRHYGPLRRASVVYNGRSADRFIPATKDPLVFAAGRLWDRAKNVGVVTDVARHLSWPVVVAGAGADSSDGVRHLGRISEREIAAWLGRAAIFVHPARYEPFGLLPLEAALSGCALVLGDIPSLREVWDDAAVFVPSDDRDALKHAIERLSRSEPLRHAMATRAREKALAYTTDRMAEKYLSIYDCVCGGVARQSIADTETTSDSNRRLPCAS